MPSARYRGPPMTLANMRAQGVRSLWVVCELCHHEAVINVDGYGDALPARLRPPYGLQPLWDRQRLRQAELAGEADERKPDRPAVAMSGPEG